MRRLLVGPWTSLRIAIASGIVAICVVVVAILNAGDSQAYPYYNWCPYPANGVSALGFGYCDYPPDPAGMHWHCEWGWLGLSSCSWRWLDNTFAPPPWEV